MEQETVNLIRKAQSGDTEAFHNVVAQYDHQVMTLALKLLKNVQDAEDIYQEVFMKVFKNMKKFRFESDFSTWLYRITVNTVFNFKKRMKRHYRLEPGYEDEGNIIQVVPDPDTSRMDDSREVQRAVMTAVDNLPLKQRTVFILKHIESLKIRDIAALLDCSEGTVKKYLFRALEKLRAELGEYRYA